MKNDKKCDIFDYITELESKKESSEWNEFSDNFGNFINFSKPYLFPNKRGKYKKIDDKNQKKLEELFEKTMVSTNKFLSTDAEDEIDEIRHEMVKKLNDEFLLKFSDRLKNLDGQKKQTLNFSKYKNNNVLDDNKEKIHFKKSVAKIFGLEGLFEEPHEGYEILNDSSKDKSQIRVNISIEEIFDENLEDKLQNENLENKLQNENLENKLKDEKTPEELANLNFIDYICENSKPNKTDKKKFWKRFKKNSKVDKFKKDEEIGEKKPEDPDEEIMRQTLVIMGMGIIASERAKEIVSFDDIIFSSILVGMEVSQDSIDIALAGLNTLQKQIKNFVKMKKLKKNQVELNTNDDLIIDLLNQNSIEKVRVELDEEQEQIEENLDEQIEYPTEQLEKENESQVSINLDDDKTLTNILEENNKLQSEMALKQEKQIKEPKTKEKQ